MSIKAIQTAYKGYNFRSRLEARWAVFFDALGLQWEYEPEGFELPNGERYLPDFRLRIGGEFAGKLFAEIKPSPSTDADWLKARALAATGATVLLLAGMPRDIGNTLLLGDNLAHLDGRTTTLEVDGRTYVQGLCNAPRETFVRWSETDHLTFSWMSHRPATSARVANAILAARSARFEFGESGPTL